MNKELKILSLKNRLAKLIAKPTDTHNIERKIIRQLRNLDRWED